VTLHRFWQKVTDGYYGKREVHDRLLTGDKLDCP
jgi:hypothetical protein